MLLLSTPAITIVTLKCDGFNANYVGENLKTITLSSAPHRTNVSYQRQIKNTMDKTWNENKEPKIAHNAEMWKRGGVCFIRNYVYSSMSFTCHAWRPDTLLLRVKGFLS